MAFWTENSSILSISGAVNGTIPASAKVLLTVAAQPFSIPATASNIPSYGYADITATALTTFNINKNGVSIGTMSFAIGANSATFSFATAVSFAVGDRLSVVGPATPDTTLADVYFTIRASAA